MPHIKKRQCLLYHAFKYQSCFHGTNLHLTETFQLTDDVSLCSYLVEHTYLTYECVDKDPESVPGLNGVGWNSAQSGLLTHVEISCDGIACPPYVAGRELTCVVCTR